MKNPMQINVITIVSLNLKEKETYGVNVHMKKIVTTTTKNIYKWKLI